MGFLQLPKTAPKTFNVGEFAKDVDVSSMVVSGWMREWTPGCASNTHDNTENKNASKSSKTTQAVTELQHL